MEDLSRTSTLALMDVIKLYDGAHTPSEWLHAQKIIQVKHLGRLPNMEEAPLSSKSIFSHNLTSPFQGESIAIGCAITSRGVNAIHNDTDIPWTERVAHLPFFRDLLPSFCRTASFGYHYHFYVAHDFDDLWFADEEARRAFSYVFKAMVALLCRSKLYNEPISVRLKLVNSQHSGKPASAQNDALVTAYKDNQTNFFYRVNDDTSLGTAGWTEIFISVLAQFQPPLVGVVGPSFSAPGFANFDILTYEFVHRTHVEIFNFYYPPLLTSWYADDWITRVYQPGRCIKVSDVQIMHTQKFGRRYDPDERIKDQLLEQIHMDRGTLQRWITNNTHTAWKF